jgi:transcriptional regulator with GAF, ATPase, and Fis domain
LRERVQDVLPLTEFFVAKFAASLNKPINLIPDEVMAVLKAHDWPGTEADSEHILETSGEANWLIGGENRAANRLGLPPLPTGSKETHGQQGSAAGKQFVCPGDGEEQPDRNMYQLAH